MTERDLQLPPELWWGIFSYLGPGDLCRISLVSRQFQSLASTPYLWLDTQVSRLKIEQHGLARLLSSTRLSMARNIDLSYLDLTKESKTDLVTTVRRFARLRLRYSKLTEPQKLEILKACLRSPALLYLDLDSVDLSKAPPAMLARCLLHGPLVSLLLSNSSLTQDQLSELLYLLPTSSLQDQLSLSSLDLSGLAGGALRPAVSKVKTLDLANTVLTHEQVEGVLTECLWSTSIETLDLTGFHLSLVSPQLLSDAASCLNSLVLCSCEAPQKQMLALLHSLRLDCSTLNLLSLACMDLTQVPGNLLASSLPSLTHLTLSYSRLETPQITAIIRSLSKSSTTQVLELASLDLREVPAPLITKLVLGPQLTSLNLNHAKLTSQQTIALLTASSSRQSGLVDLGLVRADLTLVPPSVLAKAKGKVRNINLSYAKLSQGQEKIIKKR